MQISGFLTGEQCGGVGGGGSASSFLILPSARPRSAPTGRHRSAAGPPQGQAAGPDHTGRPAPLSPKALGSGRNAAARSSRPEVHVDFLILP